MSLKVNTATQQFHEHHTKYCRAVWNLVNENPNKNGIPVLIEYNSARQRTSLTLTTLYAIKNVYINVWSCKNGKLLKKLDLRMNDCRDLYSGYFETRFYGCFPKSGKNHHILQLLYEYDAAPHGIFTEVSEYFWMFSKTPESQCKIKSTPQLEKYEKFNQELKKEVEHWKMQQKMQTPAPYTKPLLYKQSPSLPPPVLGIQKTRVSQQPLLLPQRPANFSRPPPPPQQLQLHSQHQQQQIIQQQPQQQQQQIIQHYPPQPHPHQLRFHQVIPQRPQYHHSYQQSYVYRRPQTFMQREQELEQQKNKMSLPSISEIRLNEPYMETNMMYPQDMRPITEYRVKTETPYVRQGRLVDFLNIKNLQ